MRTPAWICLLASIFILSGCEDPKSLGDPFGRPAGAEEGEWPLHGYGHGEQRYSPLDSINADNVGELGLAFSFDDFVVRGRTHRGTQASPIMSDGILYFTGPWSVVYAIDAATGEHKWTYDPEVEGGWARHACCDAVNRGIALLGDTAYVATLDGYLVALDAATGAERWRTDTFVDRTRSYTITGAPRIAGDKIVIGNGGAELGVRGYVSAYDAADGNLAWRFFTVPGAGPDEHPEVAMARETWADDARFDLGGGGTVWDSMTYDPDLDTIFIGVGNGGPWPAWVRNGGQTLDNLFLSSILALDAATGELRWHYQTTPGDSWDYTASQNMILADLEIDGRTRKVLMQAPKNGFFYVIDRETGTLISAENFTRVTWASGVDLDTGRPVLTGSADYREETKVVWPSTAGGHNWHPMAYSAQSGLVYIPVLEMPMKFTSQPAIESLLPGATNTNAQASPPNSEADASLMEGQPPFVQQAVLKAWDPVEGKVAWQSEPMPWWSGGVLATGGGLVFAGSTDGAFTVYDATTGAVLKRFKTGLAIMAPPVTYSVGDRQYVAVLAGLGGAMNGRYMAGFAAHEYQNRERLLVFALGGRDVDLPPKVEPVEAHPIPDGLPTDAGTLAQGQRLYMQYCVRCHGFKGSPNGYPNLWNMSPGIHESFDQIVLEGSSSYAGMASFSDVLDEDDTEAIRAFIAADRRGGQGGPVEAVESGGH